LEGIITRSFIVIISLEKSARNMDLSMDFTNSYGPRPQDDFKLTKG
jgi:hypothetical protein